MEKITVKLPSYENHLIRYSLLYPSTDAQFIRTKFVENKNGEIYTPKDTTLKIPLGTLEYWIDIYARIEYEI